MGIILISSPMLLFLLSDSSAPGFKEGFLLGLLLSPVAIASTILSLRLSGGGQSERVKTWGRWIALLCSLVIFLQILFL
jgi:hypothetical protein